MSPNIIETQVRFLLPNFYLGHIPVKCQEQNECLRSNRFITVPSANSGGSRGARDAPLAQNGATPWGVGTPPPPSHLWEIVDSLLANSFGPFRVMSSLFKCRVGNHFRVLSIRKIFLVQNCEVTWELHIQALSGMRKVLSTFTTKTEGLILYFCVSWEE